MPYLSGTMTLRLQDVDTMMGDMSYAGLHGSSVAGSKGSRGASGPASS